MPKISVKVYLVVLDHYYTTEQKKQANHRLEVIYEDAGLEYEASPPGDSDRLRENLQKRESLRRAKLKEILVKIATARNLQLCFVVDATRSMERYLQEIRDSIY